MSLPNAADQVAGANSHPRLSIEAPAGGLLGALVAAFLRTEYPQAELLSATASGSEAVTVGADDRDAKMIVFPADPNPTTVARLATTGRHSIVCLGSSLDDLRTAMHRMLSGEPPFLSPSLVRLLASASLRASEPSSSGQLTPREMEIVRLLTLGLSNQEMASNLSVSTNTVRAHLQAVSTKLGVSGRTRVIARARELELSR